MAKWIQKAIKHPGALTAQAKRAGAWDKAKQRIRPAWLRAKAKAGGTIGRRAMLALTLRKMHK